MVVAASAALAVAALAAADSAAAPVVEAAEAVAAVWEEEGDLFTVYSLQLTVYSWFTVYSL